MNKPDDLADRVPEKRHAGREKKGGPNMKVYTCEYVCFSDVFKRCPAALELFNCADHKGFTWGDCNRSLISAERLIGDLEDLDPNTPAEERQIKKVINRLKKLGRIYIDLEN
jgi:hypothetical protein